MEFNKVMVVGAGTMGNGIAQVCATAGVDTYLMDIDQGQLDKAIARINKGIDKLVEKERISADDGDAAKGRLTSGTEMKFDCDLIIEAATENRELKAKIFKQMDDGATEGVILATNTSSIPITEIAAATSRPTKVIGMHFMNPVPLMKLVEIIRGHDTDDETYTKIENFSKELGKVPACSEDYPGFIANRILMPLINEACYALMEGVGDKEAIDTVAKLGLAHPMGPLTLADLIGLDVCLFIMEVLYEGLGDQKYAPCPLLRRMVAAGHLGRKTGRGFYDYN